MADEVKERKAAIKILEREREKKNGVKTLYFIYCYKNNHLFLFEM
jgi:hypothetical protein